MRFGRRSKGVISIFLIIILLPMMTIGVILIDGSRVRSAKVIVQEAADIAAISVLSDYNTKLKDEFGLFSINNPSSARSKFDAYLKASLNAYGGADVNSYSDMVRYLLQRSTFGGGDYANLDFLNLYNFNVQNANVEMLYNLGDIDVLESQIVEYVKFRGIVPIVQRLPALSQAQELKNEIEKVEKDLDVMSEKIEIDETFGTPVESTVAEIESLITREQEKDGYYGYNKTIKDLKEIETEYYQALSRFIEELEEDDDGESMSSGDEYNEAKTALEDQLTEVSDVVLLLKNKCTIAINHIDVAIGKYQAFVDKYNSFTDDDSSQKRLSDDAKKTINDYNNCKTKIQTLLNELNALNVQAITNAAKQQIRAVDMELGNVTVDYEDCEETIHNEIEKLKDEYIFMNPLIGSLTSEFELDEAKDIANEINEKNKETVNESEKTTLTNAEYDALPSKNKNLTEYEYEDIALDETKGSETVKSVSSSLQSYMKDFISSSTNDLLVYSYILGTFKTRITGNENIKYNEPPDPLKRYHTKWRYGDKPISDLRGHPMAERTTKFKNAEIEYIFAGKRSEAQNERIVYAWIYTTRIANNLVAVYMDKNGANAQCLAAASVAAAATGFVVPVSVFHWIFMTAWAAGETSLEMDMLINKGYSLPLIKTKDNLYIEHIGDIARAVGGDDLGGETSDNGFLVSYEDYLVIMLAFVGAETRLYRTADLIQLNMVAMEQSDFKMSGAYTYFRTSSDIGIKYLFSSTSQFNWGYSGKGIQFSNTIYKGY